MFFLSYALSELRRRRGRTLLTATGLGVGVGLVVAVNALSAGLDDAQEKVLAPLTGVGTDMTVTRPLSRSESGGFGGQDLSPKERSQLRDEVGPGPLQFKGKPGEKFKATNFLSGPQLSFADGEVARIAKLDGVADAAGSLTLTAATVSGKVPKGARSQGGPPPAGAGGAIVRQSVDANSMSITGVDRSKPSLAAVTPSQITSGRYLRADDEVVLNVAYAKQHALSVGDTVTLKGRKLDVVGLAQTPLGGSATDVYMDLARLQRMSGREGRVNQVQVRATNADAVPAVAKAIERDFDNASVTTSADLAERIGGSLVDAKNLSGKLGTALTIVALVAAFLIASLLTLASVAKRTRELGTLKAIGWPQRLVVRQVTGESVAQGLLGGVIGAALGLGAAALVGAMGITLEASVAAPERQGGGPIGPAFGQGQVTSGTTDVALGAPVDPRLLLVAGALAVLGGLVAGSAGGLRAARLRPAEALRHIG
jgi:ABC-type antimicrobial peptide transport system permease subunit